MRTRLAKFVLGVQAFLLGAHAFLFATWRFFVSRRGAPWWLAVVLALSFVVATLADFRWPVRALHWLYAAAACWLALACYGLLAALACWPLYAVLRAAGAVRDPRLLGPPLFAAAGAVALYGFINAARPRVKRLRVTLDNLPPAWRGRSIVVVSDLHLGPVRGAGFSRRLVRAIARLQPAAVCIPGDFFDGSPAHLERFAAPWKRLRPPQGVYFAAGNHEQFRDPGAYVAALERAGVRVLQNAAVGVDGLQIAGIDYRTGTHAAELAERLAALRLDRNRAAVLLLHAPTHPGLVEAAGVGLQISGHTHAGQTFPFNWLVRRVWGRYSCGLARHGRLQVYVSSGAGTWGPPVRVGTTPEIVVIDLA